MPFLNQQGESTHQLDAPIKLLAQLTHVVKDAEHVNYIVLVKLGHHDEGHEVLCPQIHP